MSAGSRESRSCDALVAIGEGRASPLLRPSRAGQFQTVMSKRRYWILDAGYLMDGICFFNPASRIEHPAAGRREKEFE